MADWTKPAGWEIAPNGEKFTEDENKVRKASLKFFSEDSLSSIFSAMPALGQAYLSSFFYDGGDVTLSDEGMSYDISLSFSELEPDEPAEGVYSYNLEVGEFEKDIEAHPNYLPEWNHYQIRRVGTIEADLYPGFAFADLAGLKDHRLVKQLSEMPDGWEVVEVPTKPGITSYIVGSPVVSGVRYWRNYATMVAANPAADVGRLSVPGETFGLPTSAICWLLMSCSVTFDGKYWTADEKYQYADEWDSEIYV